MVFYGHKSVIISQTDSVFLLLKTRNVVSSYSDIQVRSIVSFLSMRIIITNIYKTVSLITVCVNKRLLLLGYCILFVKV